MRFTNVSLVLIGWPPRVKVTTAPQDRAAFAIAFYSEFNCMLKQRLPPQGRGSSTSCAIPFDCKPAHVIRILGGLKTGELLKDLDERQPVFFGRAIGELEHSHRGDVSLSHHTDVFGREISLLDGLIKNLGHEVFSMREPRAKTTLEGRTYDDMAALAIGLSRHFSLGMNGQLAHRTALIVDDDALVRLTIAALLEDLGFRVTEAAAAGDALQVLEAAPGFDVVVTDIIMPGMDGWTFAERIRARQPSMPIVYVSGYSAEGARPVERSRVVWKPFSERQLAQAIREVLGL